MADTSSVTNLPLLVEFCDYGDMGQLLSVYNNRKKSYLSSLEDYIPDSFIWHSFLALVDGLHFLATGSSYVALDLCRNDPATWRPLVHRDIKPDNVMLKSRSTPGSTKPLYVIITDFGMAEYESDSISSGPTWPVFGTPEYHALELCFDPSPATQGGLEELASPHTLKSDIWAVAAIVHASCERDVLAHMDRDCLMPPSPELRWRGRAARKQVLQIEDCACYSDRLGFCIKWAGHADPAKRPDAQALVPAVKDAYGSVASRSELESPE
jgi:NIMA (never in mitosis gene a)-related kinase